MSDVVMKLHFLGTGTSSGVPILGCSCPVCLSPDERDHRLRSSVLLESSLHTRILIDCGPDFRQQMLSLPFLPLDGVLLTHLHYDHIGGLDDLRPFSSVNPVDIYADERTNRSIMERMPYCFQQGVNTFIPHFNLVEVQPNCSFFVKELEIMPIRVMHGKLPILGFRIHNFAYLTDLKTLPEDQFDFLKDLDILVLDALQFKKNHPTHENIEDALALIDRLDPGQTFLIHMSHNAGLHAESQNRLPENVSFSYDGLEVCF